MCGKQIKIAGFLYEALDKQRKVYSTGQKESFTSLICRQLGIEYIPHGVPKKKPLSGKKPKFLVKRPKRSINRPIFKRVERDR